VSHPEPNSELQLTKFSIIYGYFEIAAKEGEMGNMKGMIMG
jgi:hypothetical protein